MPGWRTSIGSQGDPKCDPKCRARSCPGGSGREPEKSGKWVRRLGRRGMTRSDLVRHGPSPIGGQEQTIPTEAPLLRRPAPCRGARQRRPPTVSEDVVCRLPAGRRREHATRRGPRREAPPASGCRRRTSPRERPRRRPTGTAAGRSRPEPSPSGTRASSASRASTRKSATSPSRTRRADLDATSGSHCDLQPEPGPDRRAELVEEVPGRHGRQSAHQGSHSSTSSSRLSATRLSRAGRP